MISVLLQRAAKAALMATLRTRALFFPVPKRDRFYFGYGANMDPEHLRELGLNIEFLGVSVLKHHRLEFSMPCEYYGVGYASVTPHPGTSVFGALYVTDSLSLALLDILEWVPFGAYSRRAHSVELVGGGMRQAQVYFAAHPRAGLLPPGDYKGWLVESAKKLGVHAEYISEIERHETREPGPIDPEFDLLFQGKVRIGARHPAIRAIYRFSDKIRERIAEAL